MPNDNHFKAIDKTTRASPRDKSRHQWMDNFPEKDAIKPRLITELEYEYEDYYILPHEYLLLASNSLQVILNSKKLVGSAII